MFFVPVLEHHLSLMITPLVREWRAPLEEFREEIEERTLRVRAGVEPLMNVDFVINSIILKDEEIDSGRIALLGESFGRTIAICYAARDKRIKALGVKSSIYDAQYAFKKEVEI